MKRSLFLVSALIATVAVVPVSAQADTSTDPFSIVWRSASAPLPATGVRSLADRVSVTTLTRPTSYELVRNGVVVSTGQADRTNMTWLESTSPVNGLWDGRWFFTLTVTLSSRSTLGERVDITLISANNERTTLTATPSVTPGVFAKIQFARNSSLLTSTSQRFLKTAADTAIQAGTTRLKITTYRDSREASALATARAAAIKTYLAALRPSLELELNPVTMVMSERATSKDRVALISAYLP